MGYQVFILLLPILTIPYVSRVLGPTGIGINAFTNSIVQYFVLFGTLGMTMYGNREVAYQRDQPKKLSNLFWELSLLRFITTVIATMVYIAFIILSGEYQLFYLIQGLFLVANAVDVSWFFQGLEEFRITVLRNTLVKIVSLISIFVLVRTRDDLWLYVLILSGSQVLGNLTLLPYLKRYITWPHWSGLTLKRHFRPTIEMFVPQIATQVYLQLNKTMLGALIGVQASGFYDNSDKIVKIILAVVTATGTVLLPHSAHSYSQGRYDIIETSLDRSMHFILLLAFPLATGLAGVAPLFTHVFFGKGFSPVADLLIIESIVIVLVGISNALNLPLILLFQSDGAMVATVLSELLVTVYQLIKVRQQIDVFKLFREVWKYAFSAFVMGVLVRIFTIILPIQSIALLLLAVLWGGIVYFLILGLLRPHELMKMILVLKKKSE